MVAGVPEQHRARLLIDCPDRRGIVAAVSGFLARHEANIVESDQHSTHPTDGRFYMRMEFDAADPAALRDAFGPEVGDAFAMTWRIVSAEERKRLVVLASREPHCLLDLLWRWRAGELRADIPCVISNHPDHRDAVEALGIPYVHIPVERGAKAAAERELLEHLQGADVAVLARYMQILSGELLAEAGIPFINIHHSFLPAFVGAQPYRQAFDRGVKIIGATAHYVTEELDAGPIIEQDVARVTHRAEPDELARLGADIERVVLARAVRWHLDDRIIAGGHKTVVF
ncbi:MAG: formyltetrahydrofolate deformylase [Actinomycetota bacterium]|nr:formyltetrahydrofolate deformylase [Actinomycetota bacterium]